MGADCRELRALLRRLLAARLSRFEPDPLNALARVEAEHAAKSTAGTFPPSNSLSSPQTD
jgi:hypothetical protein